MNVAQYGFGWIGREPRIESDSWLDEPCELECKGEQAAVDEVIGLLRCSDAAEVGARTPASQLRSEVRAAGQDFLRALGAERAVG
ncbi:MAG: hypothetical protein MJD61_20945 [Proteobacteria bacterium]|nr:hypothetical protein [Pseudomonadota bacterium]